VGGKPFAPVFIDGGRAIRLVHLGTRDITELDAATLEPRRRIPLPIPARYAPIEAWVLPGTDTAFVTCRDSIGMGRPGIVAVVDLAGGACVKQLVPGIYPWHLVPDPGATRLFVNDFQSSRISVIDVARREVVDSLVVENGPAAILPVEHGRTLLVSCFYTHRVLVVDVATGAVKRRFDVGSNPTMLLPAGDGVRVWVLCGGESELQLLDLRSGRVLERHALPFGAYAMQLVPTHAKAS
jgi:DNA-binding beta-propeller fold protein YncE